MLQIVAGAVGVVFRLPRRLLLVLLLVVLGLELIELARSPLPRAAPHGSVARLATSPRGGDVTR